MKTESVEHLKQLFENSPFNNLVGITLEDFQEGAVVYSLKISPSHLNVNSGVHGGALFSLLDSVMGATIRSAVHNPIVTVNMNIHYFSPVPEGDTLTGTAAILQQGRSIITAEGLIKASNGTILTKAIGTFKIIRQSKD